MSVIHKLIKSFMIGFYFKKYLSLYNSYLETVPIHNQRILHFVSTWSKEVPVNISYPRTANKINGYLDTRVVLSLRPGKDDMN